MDWQWFTVALFGALLVGFGGVLLMLRLILSAIHDLTEAVEPRMRDTAVSPERVPTMPTCPHAVDRRFLRCLLCQDQEATTAERARIRAAVEVLPVEVWASGIGVTRAVDRAAVLAIVEGTDGLD